MGQKGRHSPTSNRRTLLEPVPLYARIATVVPKPEPQWLSAPATLVLKSEQPSGDQSLTACSEIRNCALISHPRKGRMSPDRQRLRRRTFDGWELCCDLHQTQRKRRYLKASFVGMALRGAAQASAVGDRQSGPSPLYSPLSGASARGWCEWIHNTSSPRPRCSRSKVAR